MQGKFPETVVLSVTVHGRLMMDDDDGGVETFVVPSGMNIAKYSAVALGVCNMTSESDMIATNNIIREEFRNPNLTFEQVKEKLASIVPRIKGVTRLVEKAIRGYKNPDENDLDYIRTLDRGATVMYYASGQRMLDKDYGRSTGEGTGSADDFKINMINVPGQPDLFKLFTVGRTTATTRASAPKEQGLVIFSQLVEYLKYHGVKNIVLFDFSCSQLDVVPRGIRGFRRDAAPYFNGGRRLRKTLKTKRTTRKKRTSLWIPSNRRSRATLKSTRSSRK